MVNKNILALGFVSFFTDMASSMIGSVLPLFIVYGLHEGVDKLGFVVAIATFVSYAFRIVFGVLSDRYRIVKPFVVAGYLVSAVTKPLLALATSWPQVAGLRGTERMGKAIRSATKDSLIAAWAGAKSGRSFGIHKMMDAAGEVSGALIAFGVLYLLGKDEAVFRELFGWTLVPGLLAVIVLVLFVEDAPYRAHPLPEWDWREDRAMLPHLLFYFVFVFFLLGDAFFLIRAKESGIPILYAPLLIVLYQLVQTVLSYAAGVQIDRFSPRNILVAAMAFGVASVAALAMNWVVTAFVLLGIFTVASLNALRTWIADEATRKGTVYGFLYGGVALFAALGAVVAGQIWHHAGAQTAMLFSVGGLSVDLAVYGVYLSRVKS